MLNRDPRPEHLYAVPRVGAWMRIWGWWTAWRVEQMAKLDECEHDNSAPMCWACVLLCCYVR